MRKALAVATALAAAVAMIAGTLAMQPANPLQIIIQQQEYRQTNATTAQNIGKYGTTSGEPFAVEIDDGVFVTCYGYGYPDEEDSWHYICDYKNPFTVGDNDNGVTGQERFTASEPFFVERDPGVFVSCNEVTPEGGWVAYTMCDHENTYTADQVELFTHYGPGYGDRTNVDHGSIIDDASNINNNDVQLEPESFYSDNNNNNDINDDDTTPRWPWSVTLGDSLQVFGPRAAECLPALADAAALINGGDDAYFPWLVSEHLPYILCVELAGSYPQEFGYVVVELGLYVLPEVVFAGDTTTWLASAMVHEACHVHQYRTGVDHWGYGAEMQCTELQLSALYAMDAPQGEKDHLWNQLNDPDVNWWH